jgi:hypothetical protein
LKLPLRYPSATSPRLPWLRQRRAGLAPGPATRCARIAVAPVRAPLAPPVGRIRRTWNHFCTDVVAPMLAARDQRSLAWLRRRGFAPLEVPIPGEPPLHALSGPGRGPLPHAVFVHGLGASIADHPALLGVLQGVSRRVTAIDLPGHGGSAALQRVDHDTLVGVTRRPRWAHERVYTVNYRSQFGYGCGYERGYGKSHLAPVTDAILACPAPGGWTSPANESLRTATEEFGWKLHSDYCGETVIKRNTNDNDAVASCIASIVYAAGGDCRIAAPAPSPTGSAHPTASGKPEKSGANGSSLSQKQLATVGAALLGATAFLLT